MSHFNVLVVVDPERLARCKEETDSEDAALEMAVGELMSPYQENNMGTCPEEYLEFHDREEEMLEDYNTKTIERVRMPDGQLVSPYDDQFRVEDHETLRPEFKVPEGLEQLEVPFSEVYSTFDEYVQDYEGYKGRDEKTGRYGYWENPNRKWDYWTIGGRWRGHLLVKQGILAQRGKLSWEYSPEFNNGVVHEDAPQSADVACFDEVDWAGMDAEVDTRIDGFWDTILLAKKFNLYDPNLNDEDRQAAWKQAKEADIDTWSFFSLHSTLWDMGLRHRKNADEPFVEEPFTLEDLKTKYRWKWEFGTYAVVTADGKWHEPGEMGWFGCSGSTPESSADFHANYKKRFLEGLDPNTMLVICDCHI